jgi:hypothetical protein
MPLFKPFALLDEISLHVAEIRPNRAEIDLEVVWRPHTCPSLSGRLTVTTG